MPRKDTGKGPPATGKPTKKTASSQMARQAKSLKKSSRKK
jgi:hypothetical protein